MRLLRKQTKAVPAPTKETKNGFVYPNIQLPDSPDELSAHELSQFLGQLDELVVAWYCELAARDMMGEI